MHAGDTTGADSSVVDALGYRFDEPNVVQRALQRVAASRAGAWLLRRTLHPIDRQLFRRSGGRVTAPSLVAGLPVIMLTTTGARSGAPRTMPLLGIPMEGDLAVIGSNFGQRDTPGWVFNLEADPRATVAFRDREVDVVARMADDAEADRAFARAATVYPGYEKYRDRARHRRIRVFVLGRAPTGV